MRLVPPLGRQGQENLCELKSSLVYILRSRMVKATQICVSKKQNEQEEEKEEDEKEEEEKKEEEGEACATLGLGSPPPPAQGYLICLGNRYFQRGTREGRRARLEGQAGTPRAIAASLHRTRPGAARDAP